MKMGRVPDLAEAVEALGLRIAPPKNRLVDLGLTARGEFDGASVVLEYGDFTVTTLRAEHLPVGMALRSEQGLFISSPIQERLDLFWKEGHRGEVLIGDIAFDNMIAVRGAPETCRALLNAVLRERVTAVIGARDARMEGERLTMFRGGFSRADELREWAQPFIRLVKEMMARAKRGTEACLAENAVAERIWEVRAFNLAELGRHFSGTPATLETARTVLKKDIHPWCRTLAAACLGAEGVPVLRQNLQDAGSSPGLRATALYHLGRTLPGGEAEPLLVRYLDSKEWPVPSAAVAALEEGAGTVAAVPALLELSKEAWRRSVRQEAARAADRIQARIEGAGAGQLSVAEGEGEGRLSRPEP